MTMGGVGACEWEYPGVRDARGRGSVDAWARLRAAHLADISWTLVPRGNINYGSPGWACVAAFSFRFAVDWKPKGGVGCK